MARESMQIATLGARRLLNLNDEYQGSVFDLLFKTERDFSIFTNEDTEAWNLVEVEGWIGAMEDKYEVNRDLADVRIYCDNDARWTRVPNDPRSIARGVIANSDREFGIDAEYEDTINFMRRDTWNEGCQQDMTLGVTYSGTYSIRDTRVPDNYHRPRQTITICDLAFKGSINQFAVIQLPKWRTAPMAALNIIPTNFLLYQLLNLEPYGIWRDVAQNFENHVRSVDLWSGMLSSSEAELSRKPAPYAWNAVLAYAASIGWGLQSGLTEQEYIEGKDLFRYSTALKNPAFTRGGPVTLPPWMGLPPDFIAGGAG